MLDLSTQDPAGIADSTRTAEAEALSADAEATAAIEAFAARHAELRTEAMMGILTAAQTVELERLRKAMYTIPTVASYVAATEAFGAICRETAAVITAQIGIDFAANCRAGGCCG
jgi:cell fate (sporulation/competence/biofilm development) regulator YlbF (YheA/YmcA/DUF963 family)